MEFQYKPLPSDSVAIRILELHPGRKGEKITCSLQQISFPTADGETYEPLSYCWGDSRDKVSITVENCSVEVTRNLHAALDRLRLTDKKRRMWVDAFCINQDDDIEKTKQVQMMREIYSCGKETLLWLGPGSRHSYTSSSWNLIPKVVNGTFKYTARDQVKRFFSLGHYNNITGLISIFLLPYFTRVWAIQEVAASPLVRVYYGDNESYSWDDLDAIVDGSSNWSHYSYGTRAFFGAFMNIDFARSGFQTKSMPGLLQLLEDHRYASATLAKDKIYGLLGLLPPEERELYGIVPNYLEEYTTEEAFIDTAVSILRGTGNLNLLSIPRGSRTSSLLPSWVPDWNSRPESNPLISVIEEHCFAATGSSTSHPIYLIRDGRHLLELSGFILDEIDCVGHPAPDEPPRMDILSDSSSPFVPIVSKGHRRRFGKYFRKQIRFQAKFLMAQKDWLVMMRSLQRETYITGETMSDAFYETPMCFCEICSMSDRESRREVYRRQVGHFAGPSGIFDCAAIWFAYYVVRDTAQYFKSPPKRAQKLLLRTHGRRMFTTKGTYLGLGPKDTQKGDLLALLQGRQMPYVLRRKGKFYELVGDCYVHGVMQGERYDESRCEKICLI